MVAAGREFTRALGLTIVVVIAILLSSIRVTHEHRCPHPYQLRFRCGEGSAPAVIELWDQCVASHGLRVRVDEGGDQAVLVPTHGGPACIYQYSCGSWGLDSPSQLGAR